MNMRQISIPLNAIRMADNEQLHPKTTTKTAGFEDGKIKRSTPVLHKSLSRHVLAGACRSCGWRLILTMSPVSQR
jgi:hypothetical protein